nr:transposase [Bradyrhizobium sp.]
MNGRVEIITSVERRRRWSAAEKRRLVAATLAPGASVSAIAREAGVHPSQLWGWAAADAGDRAGPVHAGARCGGSAIDCRRSTAFVLRRRAELRRVDSCRGIAPANHAVL